jgi:hypothetical protein
MKPSQWSHVPAVVRVEAAHDSVEVVVVGATATAINPDTHSA